MTSPPTITRPTAVAASTVELRPRAALDPSAVAAANRLLDGAEPADIVRWAIDRFGRRVALTASFADTLLIDIVTRVEPDVEVVFLDTGFHFAETLATVRRAMERYSLHLTVLRPGADAADVWADGSDACCATRKVAPLDRYLTQRAGAWFSGVRRADGPARADAEAVSIDRRGLVKINPIVAMGDDEYADYVSRHDVIVNPLQYDGYSSIGCWPCTEPAADGRSGRWAGSSKTECGLHL